MIILGFVLCLIGGAMIETPIVGFAHGEGGIVQIIAGIIFGAVFVGPGVAMIWWEISDRVKQRKKDPYLKELLEALAPGFREAVKKTGLDHQLVSFRQHYSEFLSKPHTEENEKVQHDVTQVFRNIMQLQKDRLSRLGLTCELVIRRMQYTKEDGLTTRRYSDGKYSITDVREEVAAQTVYKKNGKPIFTRQDKDTANYTIIEAEKVGKDKLLCPNCGVETTREALLDGCDYCGTKFSVEDLGSRIAVFAFRPDFRLRYEKYLRQRNRLLFILAIGAVLSVFAGFTVYGITHFSELLEEADGGIILTLLAEIFAVVVASPVYILSFLIVYGGYILPIAAILGYLSWQITKRVRAIKNGDMLAREREQEIRRYDPQFSIANFYSGVQNKLSSVLFADSREQIQSFAQKDLTPMLGKYADVVGVDVNAMEITRYSVDAQLQHAGVDVRLRLTRCRGEKCVTRWERVRLELAKAADCKTQVVCAPAMLTCRGCGASLDLLRGKRCEYCGRELELVHYDWVIEDFRRVGSF